MWFQNRRTKHKRIQQEEDGPGEGSGSKEAGGSSEGGAGSGSGASGQRWAQGDDEESLIGEDEEYLDPNGEYSDEDMLNVGSERD